MFHGIWMLDEQRLRPGLVCLVLAPLRIRTSWRPERQTAGERWVFEEKPPAALDDVHEAIHTG